MQRASTLFRPGEAAMEQLTTWMETAYLCFHQRGIPLGRLSWFTEEGPKGTRRLVCEVMDPEPPIAVRVNGERIILHERVQTYEQLVVLARQQGTPSMIVDFANKSFRPVAVIPGQGVRLDDGAKVTVVHTGNA